MTLETTNQYYILVPTASVLDPAMFNRSTSKSTDDCAKTTIDSTEYCILEVPKDKIELTSIFDNFAWLEAGEVKEITEG